ncbi:MAG TPA: PLP-dependent aminotransferase family protein [Streptosporangiaceae bacterium]|nr:PLP-dependent aminotransferase family protein [Streptosporangiaceae bacterium]
MEKTWANSGLDLHLDLPRSRVRAGLENALRDAVRDGRLHPGVRLPPSRALAADLGIARNTVADAYGQLVAEGWLTARTGAGTWVTPHRPRPRPAPAAAPEEIAPPRYDLRAGVPDLGAFPHRAWLAAARTALAAVPAHALGYPDPRGVPQLRAALAAYLSRARGVSVTGDRIVVCSGFAHGLAVICQLLRARGATAIAIEGYGHRAHRRVAEAHGLRCRALPVDGDGAAPGRLGRAAGAVLTPAHQFPLGVTLAPGRRRSVIEWAAASGGLVIEDDYDGEFRYDRQPVGAMQALAPDHVVYAGTASKSLAPGLRLGWLAVPGPLLDEVVAAKEAVGAHASTLDQLAMAEFLTSGGYDRQIRHARLAYRRRRDRLAATVHHQAPQVAVSGIAAGLHALLRLPAGQDEDGVVASAAAHGLAIEGLASYHAGGARHGPALVIGYARPPEYAFTAALARLGAVLAAASRAHRSLVAGHLGASLPGRPH